MSCTHQRISMLSGDCCDCDKPALVLVRESRIRIVTLEAERDAAIEREADLRTALAVVQEEREAAREVLRSLVNTARPFATSTAGSGSPGGVQLDEVTYEQLGAFRLAHVRAANVLEGE